MLTPNLKFTMVLDAIITTLLGSTQFIHPNTKLSQSSFFVPHPIGPKIGNTTQKFPKSHLNGLVTFTKKMFEENIIHFNGYVHMGIYHY